jgi:uncharacterized protein YacL
MILLVRVLVMTAAAAGGLALGPALGRPEASPWLGALGLVAGAAAVALERGLRSVPVDRLFWGLVGGGLGSGGGLGLGALVAALVPGAGPAAGAVLAPLLAYVGAATALAKRDDLEGVTRRLFPRPPGGGADKVLDTSVIIDGRIADVCEAGFLEGSVLVPQFVLRELQQIADSPDGPRRSRGKRGFDVLQRLQRSDKITVRIPDLDFPDVREVDRKLVELARTVRGKVVTNDQTLSRLAELQGVPVLNLNELAGALRPVALPGETLRVHVLKEGKEAGQGVAYLADGTMVVVDQGKRAIGQSVDVVVTTALQTAAGRMIFARLRDEDPLPR